MKYAIYFTWNDGFEDSMIAITSADRVSIIKNMIKEQTFTAISYCKIYKSGEYGKRTKVL